jgi:hypothetical protein
MGFGQFGRTDSHFFFYSLAFLFVRLKNSVQSVQTVQILAAEAQAANRLILGLSNLSTGRGATAVSENPSGPS